MNSIKINLIDYIDGNWSIILNKDFHNKLKNKIKNKYSTREISKLTGATVESIRTFHKGKYNKDFNYLMKICNLLNIPKKELISNIEEIYAGVKKASFKVKEININPEFIEWYALWIGEGDHSPTREAISLTNYDIDILKLHIKILKKMKFDRIDAEIVTNTKDNKNKIKKRWTNILNLPINNIKTIAYSNIATQEGARVQVWSASFFRILHKLNSKIREIVKSNDKLKIAYIKGIYAAEGSVRKKGKNIRIGMNDKDELDFIREILKDLDINTKEAVYNKFSRTYELSIWSYNNIKRFKDINGFGLNKKRRDLLEKMFSNYKYLYYDVKFDKIQELFKDNGYLTNNQIAFFLNRHPRWIATFTKNLVKQGKLKVDKSDKAYKYTLQKAL